VLSALRSPNFRWLWLGQSVSLFGDGLVIVTIGIFVTRLTGDPGDVGTVLAGYAVPLVSLLLLGGVLADRLPRRAVMIAADAVRCVVHAVLAVLIATGTVRIWHMVVIGVLFGTSQAFFQPAYTGLVPQTVPESDIQGAQALGGVSRELASFASPALATVLVLTAGGAAAFALDAATFAVSALTLAKVQARPRGEVPEQRHDSGLFRELVQGWAAVRERSWVWATVAAFAVTVLLAWAPFMVLGPSISRQVYGTDAVYGFGTAAWGVGMVAGALWGGQWRPRRPMLVGIVLAALFPTQIAVFAAGPPTTLLYASAVVAGIGLGLFGVWWETALAQRIPPHLLSRVSAWDMMGSLALMPAGYLLAGPVGSWFGDVRVLLVGGVLGTLALLLALVPTGIRRFTRLEPEASDVAPLPVPGLP
jgi:MFS family permease